ncbi:MAG: TraA family conjugative transfer protein [Mariprofundales bacterium]
MKQAVMCVPQHLAVPSVKSIKSKINPNIVLTSILAFAFVMLFSSLATAGVGGALEFQALHDVLVAWTEGWLGKTIAIFTFLLGLGVGALKQSAMPAISGFVFAMFAVYGPSIIDAMGAAVI